MNSTDYMVSRAANDYHKEHGEYPALIVVHPLIAANMTCEYICFAVRTEIKMSDFTPECITDIEPTRIARVPIKTLDTSLPTATKESITCLNKQQVMQIMLAMPHLMEVI